MSFTIPSSKGLSELKTDLSHFHEGAHQLVDAFVYRGNTGTDHVGRGRYNPIGLIDTDFPWAGFLVSGTHGIDGVRRGLVVTDGQLDVVIGT